MYCNYLLYLLLLIVKMLNLYRMLWYFMLDFYNKIGKMKIECLGMMGM